MWIPGRDIDPGETTLNFFRYHPGFLDPRAVKPSELSHLEIELLGADSPALISLSFTQWAFPDS